jgi:hypothetical protein
MTKSRNNITSIELPAEIDALIDNKSYRPRFQKLWRLYPQELVEWARVAIEKKGLTEPPSHYFAKGCKVGIWEERTLKFLAELAKVRELAERVAAKLNTAVTRFIYQQVWRGVNVERWADMAAEVGEHKGKYFTWLCRREHLASEGYLTSYASSRLC